MSWLLRRLLRYGYARALETSTWRNLILCFGGAWAATHPTQAEALIPLLVGAAGLIGAFFPDALGTTRPEVRRDETAAATPLPPIELVGRATPQRLADQSAAGDGGAGPGADPVRPAHRLPGPVDLPAERDAGPGWNG